MSKTYRKLVLGGLLALIPSVASAYPGSGESGLLIACDPTDGVANIVEVKPGLTCDEQKNKIKLETILDGCSADPNAPWDAWADAGYPSKMTATSAGTVSAISLSLKAVTYGSCNFGGSATSFTASGGGKFALLTSAGDKVKGGKGSLYASVGGDLMTGSAAAKGLVTKGFMAGAQIAAAVGLDLAAPENQAILACNIGAACTMPGMDDIPPQAALALKTSSTSYLKIGSAENVDCTGAAAPWACCTGSGTGNC